ncbi:MAG TPA: MHYT domain-containing protein [Gemmatirosa sp.]
MSAAVHTTLHAVYSPPLVVASFLIATLASYTALDFAARVAAATRATRAWWLTGGAVALGLGIWGMHFVGMLAVRLYAADGSSLATAYDVPSMLLSILVAVAAAALALSVAARAEVGRGALAGAALLLGVAVAGMHYLGMASMRLPGAVDGMPGISYAPTLVGLAYAIAAGASLAALWLARRAYQDRGSFVVRLILPAAVMGVAIAGMHYTGMASASFHPTLTPTALGLGDADFALAVSDESTAGTLLATPSLGAAVTVALFFVLAFTLIASTAGRWASTAPLPDDLLGDRPRTPTPPHAAPTQAPSGDGRRAGRGPIEPRRLRHAWRREADALDAGGPSLRTKLAAGSAAAGLVLVVALVSYWGFYQFQDAARWLTHTSQVRASVLAVETAVSEAEAAGRAYLLYGRPRYIDQYRGDVARTRLQLATVRRLTADNPQQQRRLDRIDPLLTRRFDVLDSLITLRQTSGGNAVLAALARRDSLFGVTDRGVRLADSLHTLVSEVDAAESTLYGRRSQRLAVRSRLVTITLLGGSLVAFTLILLILQAIRRDVAARQVAQVRVREQAEALAVQAEQLEQQQIELEQQVEEQQMLNEELADANQQLERSTRRRDRLIRQLERSNKDLDQFAYVASHDLKAPLRGIANLSSWIEEDLAPVMTDDTREQMHLMRGRVHRMEALIDGILQYSRAGRVRSAPEPVDTGALVADVVELIAPPEATQIIVADDMPKVLAERVPLQQVFMNLIGNAVKYARRTDGPVEVRVSWAEETVDPDAPRLYRFSIADNGPGIAPQYHERVFGIFQTLQSRDQVEGTGIGLSVVKKIVEGQGGRVWVESAEGEGATFHFTWPAAPVSTTADT